jgi:hypothetical protein
MNNDPEPPSLPPPHHAYLIVLLISVGIALAVAVLLYQMAW